jgi:hypothetical protein
MPNPTWREFIEDAKAQPGWHCVLHDVIESYIKPPGLGQAIKRGCLVGLLVQAIAEYDEMVDGVGNDFTEWIIAVEPAALRQAYEDWAHEYAQANPPTRADIREAQAEARFEREQEEPDPYDADYEGGRS